MSENEEKELQINKLFNFMEDMNAELYEKDPLFEELPLVFSSIGFNNAIEFCDTRIAFSDDYPDWTDVLGEVYRISEAWRMLHSEMTKFFQKKLNSELEAKYGLGYESTD